MGPRGGGCDILGQGWRSACGQCERIQSRTAPALCARAEPTQSVAACRSTPGWRILAFMGTKSRESIYGSSVRHSAERASEAREGS
jgi:hypothetical protein